MSRTKGPWTYDKSTGRIGTAAGYSGIGHGFTRPELDANAAFIVEACNAYDTLRADNERLREALRDLVDWFDPVNGAMTNGEHLKSGCPNDLRASIDEARAALKGEK